MDALTPEGIAALLAALPSMPPAEQEELLADLDELARRKEVDLAINSFLAFCHRVYPGFKEGPHHRNMAKYLEAVCFGAENRVTVSMPPRFGKSETISYLFVAWYLGHHPTHHIMMVTHTADLSADFGRKVRNLIGSEAYREIFTETVVASDKSAANNWATTLGGKYLAIGVGANAAGHGADLLIADDLVSEQAVLAGNPDSTFATAWNYVQAGPIQRLMPNGRIVMIGCMTAETGVLMADGSEKEIQYIRPGDRIATYEDGKITESEITNWIEHHPDYVYKIRTTSGTIVRANERHPFLVDRNGDRQWIRVRNLKVGDCMVQAVPQSDVGVRTKPGGCAAPATSESCGLKAESVPNVTSGVGGSGRVLCALQTAAARLFPQKGCAIPATASSIGLQGRVVRQSSKSVQDTSSTDTGFLRQTTTPRSIGRGAAAQFADDPQPWRTPGRDKSRGYTSITATIQKRFAAFCATTATWLSGMRARKTYCAAPLSTYACTLDPIVEIAADGFESVFDIEVERTENFIANGVVSHNTRWGKKDPIGRALQWAEQNPAAPQWTEIRFPAIMPSGKSLWPEQWPIDQLRSKQASMFPQFWAAQYMQEPTSEEGAIIKREWWRVWTGSKPPRCDLILQSWDTAHEEKSSADPSAVTTWGLFVNEDEENAMQVILLDAWSDRKEFPALKKFCKEYYDEWKPDLLIIEKKAAGAPLIQEMRAMGIPVQEFTPSRGNDKRVRMNAVADMFASGMIWAPEHLWARKVIDQVAEFPNGENDDLADTVTQAMLRIRQGGFVQLKSDLQSSEEDSDAYRQPVNYY